MFDIKILCQIGPTISAMLVWVKCTGVCCMYINWRQTVVVLATYV